MAASLSSDQRKAANAVVLELGGELLIEKDPLLRLTKWKVLHLLGAR